MPPMLKPDTAFASAQQLNQQSHELNEGYLRILNAVSQNHAGNLLEEAESIICSHIPEANHALIQLKESLESRRDQAAKGYTIALFGRTGVGKSTLAAILTESDEPIIGEGAQRTTQEILEYRWDNLIVLDTPGIGAADQEHEADESEALAAADKADLVIFIATDDALQDTEARFLAELDHRGKNLIALMNCKHSIDSPDYPVEDFLAHPEDIFDRQDTLDRYVPFAEMTANRTSRPTPEFHPAHFQAALVSQNADTPKELAQCLREASRLAPVLETIKTAVADRAKTSALKTPIDLLLPKVQEAGRELMLVSQQAAASRQIFADQHRENQKWLTDFQSNARSEISRFISSQLSPLRNSIADFAEEYAESNNIEREWKRRVEQHTRPKEAENLTNQWSRSLNKRAETIQKNVEANLRFQELRSDFAFVNKGKIRDSKRFVKWSTGLSGAAIGIATVFAPFGPAGWIIGGIAALALTGLGRIFGGKSKKEKIAERATQIRSSLNQGMTQLSAEYERKLNQHLSQLCREYRKAASQALQEQETLFQKKNTGYQGAGQNLRNLAANNHRLLAANLLNLSANGQIGTPMPSIGRVPGQLSILMVPPEKQPSSSQRDALEQALDEPVVIIDHSDNPVEIIRRCLNQPGMPVTLDLAGKIATISQETLTINQVNRIQAAEQLADVYIVKSADSSSNPGNASSSRL